MQGDSILVPLLVLLLLLLLLLLQVFHQHICHVLVLVQHEGSCADTAAQQEKTHLYLQMLLGPLLYVPLPH